MKSMYLTWAASVLLALPGNALGQAATARIDGPHEVAPGDLVVLDATKSVASRFHWLLINSEKTFLTVDEGKKLIFATGQAQQYVFVLVVAACDDHRQLSVDIAEHRISVANSPTPPPPTPDLPVGKWRFAEAAYRYATELVPANKRHYAGSLADNFAAVSAAIAAGAYRNPMPSEAIEQANQELRSRNRATLAGETPEGASNVRDWTPFFSAWQKKADSHNPATASNPGGDGTLRTVEDYGQAFAETAAGLRAVSRRDSAVEAESTRCNVTLSNKETGNDRQ